MLFDNKFDFIMSLGEDCACSSYLRKFNLQEYSYPFDWLTKASFQTRINMLCSDFQNFLDKENLEKMEKSSYAQVDTLNDYYKDTKYGFYFYHDFDSKIPFERCYSKVKSKYLRRIARMKNIIDKSNKILFVWWGRGGAVDEKKIATAYNLLVNKFRDKQIYMLLIEYSKEDSMVSLCDNHVLICKYENVSEIDNGTMGNVENNNKLFKRIKYQHSKIYYINASYYYLSKIMRFLRRMTNKYL